MVLSKEEFKKKITELNIDDDKQIELLEDIEDSWTSDVNEEYKARYEAEKKQMEAEISTLEAEAASLKAKYKERFFSGTGTREDLEGNKLIEEKIIDVKEI
jgi:hypothetical protein